MPIYEYFCAHCNFRFELLRHLSQSDEVASCPNCHNGAKRVLSSFNAPSGNVEGTSTTIGGSNPCSTCSALSCDTCRR
ncbi:MAG: zinc ribbon domain-containing protein [Dehalococcoidia bacterium]|nr:zinc ribbon domain-containing protein [Dehalococcoidia bacterium]